MTTGPTNATRPTGTTRTGPGPGPAGAGPAGPAGTRPRHRARRPGDRPRPLRDLAAGFATVYLEVESGWRSRAQTAAFMDRRLYAQLEQVWVRPGPPGKVVSITGHHVSPDVYEAVAVVHRGVRFGALALRFARQDSRWVVVNASRPEDGPLPEPAVPIPLDDEHDAFDLVGDTDADWSRAGEGPSMSLA
jgi:hypothetical protein